MDMDTLLRRWRSKPLWVRDGCLALVLVVLAAFDLRTDGPVALLAMASAISLTWRRSAPVAVLAVTGFFVAVGGIASGTGADTLLPALVAVYTVVAYDARWVGVAAGGVEAAWFCSALLLHHRDDAGTLAVATIAFYALAVAAAFAVRSRREVLDAVRDRARRADETREIEAARRVAEERLRIARELHDVIGHQVAVVNVQAAVAEQLMTVEPGHARAALAHVQEASRTLLTELQALVEVLREPDEELHDQPQPGMARIEDLFEGAGAAGLHVTTTTTGEPRPLPPVTDLAAYRVIQESLTNAHKHGDGSVRVGMTYLPTTLVLEAVNAVPPALPEAARSPDGDDTVDPGTPGTSAHTGFGLVGMRERVTALGGTLHVGREPVPGGERFVVRAVLPALATDPRITESGTAEFEASPAETASESVPAAAGDPATRTEDDAP